MGDWLADVDIPLLPAIHTASSKSVGTPYMTGGNWTNLTTWPAANRALYIPALVDDYATVIGFGWENGAAVSGNVDAGLYDINGTRIVSKGSTAQAGTSAFQGVTVTATVIDPGLYYIGMALDNATGTVRNFNTLAATLQALGVQQQATAFVLPATATFANPGSAYLPWVVMALGQVV